MPHDAKGSGHLKEDTRTRFIESEKSDHLDPWEPDHRAIYNQSDLYFIFARDGN